MAYLLLPEQKEALEKVVKRLRRESTYLTPDKKTESISSGAFYDYTYESNESLEEFKITNKMLKEYENVLNNSSVIQKFNNERVDFGTSFKVKFSDEEEEQVLTLVDVRMPSSYAREHGYITPDSLIGSAVHGEQVGSKFVCELEGDTISGTITEIVYRESKEEIKEENKEEKTKTNENVTSSSHIVDATYRTYKGFQKYKSKVKKYASTMENMNLELEKLNGITIEQRRYLEEELKATIRVMPCEQNLKTISKKKISYIRSELAKSNIMPTNPSCADVGLPVILEIENGKTTIKELNLTVNHYKGMSFEHNLSIKSLLGFKIYKAQIGDEVKIRQSSLYPSEIIRIKQFGFHQEDLLIPTSSNLESYTQTQRESSLERERYRKRNSITITPSQKELVDIEFAKISPLAPTSPYTDKVRLLKYKLDDGGYKVLNEEALSENGDCVGLGSKVGFVIANNEELEEYEVEMIECALTTETKDKYVEAFTSLGSALLSKKESDHFQFIQDGKVRNGMILSVENKELQKYSVLTKRR